LKRVLIIQTAFLGDVILATPLIEKLYDFYPNIIIDVVVKKGNEGLLYHHPKLNKIYVFDKTSGKLKSLYYLITQLRKHRYDAVINLHRFTSSGIITAFTKGKIKIGFDKNPLSFFFDEVVKHLFKKGLHEVDRNLSLINSITNDAFYKPKLYPSVDDYKTVNSLINNNTIYYCFAPSSVWFTKQLPKHKSIELINKLTDASVFLIGAPADYTYCQELINNCSNKHVINLCGKLNFLQSAALISKAKMNFVNDSAPMHIASAMDAPVTVFYCSTVPEFGFGPLSIHSKILQVTELDCKPCGLHGFKVCPKGHFKCGEIYLDNVL